MKRLLALCLLASTTVAQTPNQATPVDKIKVAKDFQIELLYSVPKETEGSWVTLTVDDKGRLYTSDQYGAIYRITPGADAASTKIAKLPIEFGYCQGILWHRGALYGQVNDNALQGRGLYRVTDSNNDGELDKVEQLRAYPNQGGEHGPHAVVATPDGEGLITVVGNQTPITEMNHSRAPTHWAEDQLFPMLLGKGFMRDVLAPGGWIAKTDLNGKTWELQATGTRNTYDGAFNRHGDFFAYDADMEWDTNTPWYRPTRVCFMQSGGEFGWRTCSKKWPVRWEDSLPGVIDIGFGSPTGVGFGYGAKFPAKYQDALFICDWSYGKMYAVHLTPKGATYTATKEEFVSASPLPLTDLIVSPTDGAMYVTIGGRKTQSGLYRVTYTGSDATGPSAPKMSGEEELLHALRRELESFHAGEHKDVVSKVWPHLGHADRSIRFAARIALEHQPVKEWHGKALDEKDPRIALTALMAVARTAKAGTAPTQDLILSALATIDFAKLKGIDRVTYIRDHMLAFTRLGEPNAETKAAIVERLSAAFPTNDPLLNRDLCELLVYCDDASIVAKAAPLVNNAPTQEEQMDYARILRFAKQGWTKETRESYFAWFPHAANYKGGASFNLFIDEIKADAIKGLSDAEKTSLKTILEAKPEAKAPSFTPKPMQFVQAWTMKDLEGLLGAGLEGNRNYANGRNMFGAATCFACHRFNGEGGAVGPDLTSVAGKFSPRDLLESIIEPSKEISDQYGSTVFTKTDGTQVIGRIANMKENNMMVCTNMMDPNNFTMVDVRKLAKTEESKVSMMPPGLLYMLKQDDILDLLAYLLSKGAPEDPMFK